MIEVNFVDELRSVFSLPQLVYALWLNLAAHELYDTGVYCV